MTTAAAFHRPRPVARLALPWMILAAVASTGFWLAVEQFTAPPLHPRYAEMLAAAHAMGAARDILWAEKSARGLTQNAQIDPNQTGMVGQEFTAITTTAGDLPAKRTSTNPDFAAALVRLIDSLGLARGSAVAVVVSGSFVGGDIATIAALESLGLRPLTIASLGASQWGANDPEFGILDMLGALYRRDVIKSMPIAAVYGGENSVGSGMDAQSLSALKASAERQGVVLLDIRPLPALIDALMEKIATATGEALKLGAIINVGGALIGLGNCLESFEFPHGISRRISPRCTSGTPGIAMRLAEQGLPVLQVLNIRQLAVEMGLPIDPAPLPIPGNNTAIYGSKQRR